jgi:NitT/TauT family transport system substrate-binding protein
VKLRFNIVLLLSLIALLFSCGSEEETLELKIGLMPAVNSLPLIIAADQGYFDDEELSVELIMFKSQTYRESALQTNEIDGSISDLINALNASANGFSLKVTSYTDGLFSLMVPPGSELLSPEAWNGRETVATGLLETSIINYVSERSLPAVGADPGKIDLISTLHMPSRLEMLLAGKLDAASLPEPVATVARLQGASDLVTSRVLASTPGVLLFTRKAVEQKSEALRRLYRAYNRAVDDLNAGAERFTGVIIEKGEFPPVVAGNLNLPVYTPARVPTREEFDDVVEWMESKGLLEKASGYDELISGDYLP